MPLRPVGSILDYQYLAAVKARLAGLDRIRRLLGDPSAVLPTERVYLVDDDYEAPEGTESAPWGRIVILPATIPWEVVEDPGGLKRIQYLVRVEFNDFKATGYSVRASLEETHMEVHGLLHNWVPTGLASMTIAIPTYRYSRPSAMLWDATRNLWFQSAEYRTEAAPK